MDSLIKRTCILRLNEVYVFASLPRQDLPGRQKLPIHYGEVGQEAYGYVFVI